MPFSFRHPSLLHCNPLLLPPLVGIAALHSATQPRSSTHLRIPCHHQTLQLDPFPDLSVPVFSPSFAFSLCTVRLLRRQLHWLPYDATVQTFCSTVIEQTDYTLKVIRIRWCLHRARRHSFAAHGNRVHAVDCTCCSKVVGCGYVAGEHTGLVDHVQRVTKLHAPILVRHRLTISPRCPAEWASGFIAVPVAHFKTPLRPPCGPPSPPAPRAASAWRRGPRPPGRQTTRSGGAPRRRPAAG